MSASAPIKMQHVGNHMWPLVFGPRRKKTCLWRFANNKGADQPAHPRSLISAFVIRFLESIISKLAASEISIFELVPDAQQAGLNLTLSETPKTVFVVTRPIWFESSLFPLNLIFLFINQNICCGYSKEPSQCDNSFENPQHMLKLIGKKIFTILHCKLLFIF